MLRKICVYPGCGASIPFGETACAAHRGEVERQTKGRNARSDRRRNAARPWRRWYHTARWKRLAAQVLRDEPICTICDAQLANVVHHKRRHRGDPALFWARDNLTGVCASCHDTTLRDAEHDDAAAERWGVGQSSNRPSSDTCGSATFFVRDAKIGGV